MVYVALAVKCGHRSRRRSSINSTMCSDLFCALDTGRPWSTDETGWYPRIQSPKLWGFPCSSAGVLIRSQMSKIQLSLEMGCPIQSRANGALWSRVIKFVRDLCQIVSHSNLGSRLTDSSKATKQSRRSLTALGDPPKKVPPCQVRRAGLGLLSVEAYSLPLPPSDVTGWEGYDWTQAVSLTITLLSCPLACEPH